LFERRGEVEVEGKVKVKVKEEGKRREFVTIVTEQSEDSKK
jgi:hypothetical protein